MAPAERSRPIGWRGGEVNLLTGEQIHGLQDEDQEEKVNGRHLNFCPGARSLSGP
jgi:hypothetical protein